MIYPIQKVAAVIIQNKQLLLVGHERQPFYWTPGGKLEEGETPLQALHREVMEELSLEITKVIPYLTYLSNHEEDGIPRKVYTFIISYVGDLHLQNEITKLVWVSKQQYLTGEIQIQSGVKNHLFPKLLNDQLL